MYYSFYKTAQTIDGPTETTFWCKICGATDTWWILPEGSPVRHKPGCPVPKAEKANG